MPDKKTWSLREVRLLVDTVRLWKQRGDLVYGKFDAMYQEIADKTGRSTQSIRSKHDKLRKEGLLP